MKKYFFMLLAWILFAFPSPAQNVAINEDGSLPNPHAIVDIKSSTKGVLIPRMSTSARLAIPNTLGLIVYDTNTGSIWYNTGNLWIDLGIGNNSSAWLLKGNSNAQDKVNFLGTTNNAPLNIRVNNQPSGCIDPKRKNAYWGYLAGKSDSIGTNNVAIGYQALASSKFGYSNVAIGIDAMYQDEETNNSVAIGDSACYHGSGFQNTAIGSKSLFSTGGSRNTAVGYQTLYANQSGYENVAIGNIALLNNTTGVDNTAIGDDCMANNTFGTYNTACGYFALWSNIYGQANAAFGEGALASNTSGIFNTAVGCNSLSLNTFGNNNTAIGINAGPAVAGLNNTVALGAGASVDVDNKVRIGGSEITVIEGQVPLTTPSDGRFKFNIQENVKGLDFILRLRPVTYQFDVRKQDDFIKGNITPEQLNSYASQAVNNQAAQLIRTGFIAQEVEQAAKNAGYDFDGIKIPKTERGYYSLSYSSFVVPLVKAVQEQENIILEQKQEINSLQARVANLERKIDEITKWIQSSH